MTKQIKILAGLLALQAVFLVVVFWPGSSSGVGKLFPGLEEVKVTGVTITDSEGRSIRLTRSPFGCVLPEADDYPCLQGKLPAFLNRVVAITTASQVAETKGSHKRLKVADDEFERIIELEVAGGARHKLYLGTSPQARSGHVRADGQDQVYLATDLSASDASVLATGWVDPEYFSVPENKIAMLTQENSKGRLQLKKEDNGDWTLLGAAGGIALDQGKARSLVTKFGSLRLLRPLGKEELESYGLKEPTAVVTIQIAAGDSSSTERVLRIGAKDPEETGFIVKSSESPYYVIMAESTVQDFLDKGSDDLLEPEPEATQKPST